MRTILALAVFALCLTSCATKPPVATTPPRARPVPVAPIAPVAAKAVADANQATRAASDLTNQVSAATRNAEALKLGMSKAIQEADRLRRQKTASEQELDLLWSMLTEERERTVTLWTDLGKAQTVAERHLAALQQAETHLGILANQAVKADEELTTLRRDHDQMTSQINQAIATEQSLRGALTKAEGDAALGKLFKTGFITALVLLVLAGAAFLFMKFA